MPVSNVSCSGLIKNEDSNEHSHHQFRPPLISQCVKLLSGLTMTKQEKETMAKDRTQKTALEMDFNEFVTWATAFILFGIGEGRSLRELVWNVLNHAVRNEVFGKGKNAKFFS